MEQHVVHVGDVAHVRARRGADDHDGAAFDPRTGDGVERTGGAHAKLQRHGSESAGACIGVGGVRGVQLIDGADGLDTVEMFKRLGEVFDVIAGNLEHLGNIELFQPGEQIIGDAENGFGHDDTNPCACGKREQRVVMMALVATVVQMCGRRADGAKRMAGLCAMRG